MYLAELHGKLPSRIERMEDILTSNVFSFFKYSTREIFLRGYLNELGFNVSNQEANDAQFIFWPRFEENTEPDLLIIVGNYYLMIEAKYYSGFAEETKKTKAQVLREIEGGKLEAKNYGKDFRLIAITADHYYKENNFEIIPSDFLPHFKWSNWQSVSSFLYNILESSRNIKKQERDFALDLYNLLDKKNLRDFQGFNSLYNVSAFLKSYASVFFEAKSAKFRGNFIGFMHSLSFDKKIMPPRKTIFLSGQKKIFTPLLQPGKLKYTEPTYSIRKTKIMTDKSEIIEPTKLAFDIIQKLYLEVSYLIKKIEGILHEEEEKFIIGKPKGYGISAKSSTALESTYVNLWLLRQFAVFFVPEDKTDKGSQTTTEIDNNLKILYLRFILVDKDINEPAVYSGVLHNIQKGPKAKENDTFEKVMGNLEIKADKIFKNVEKIDYGDAYIKIQGELIKNNLFDLFEINNSETIFKKIIEPSLDLFRRC